MLSSLFTSLKPKYWLSSTVPEKMEQRPGGILMAIPPEVRNEVYRLLLVSNEPIPIRTPRKRSFKELVLSDARGSILYVNRQIHDEAIRVFFAHNTFVVGNGSGDGEASLTGLKAFVRHVPAGLITSISELHVHVYLRAAQDPSPPLPRRRSWDTPEPESPAATPPQLQSGFNFSDCEIIPFHSGERLFMGTPTEASDLRHVYQRIPKSFTGVTAATVDFVASSNKTEIWPGRILPQGPTVTVLSGALTSLMALPHLREIRAWEDECVYTEHIIERILATGSELGKEVHFEYLRCIDGVSGRVREGDKEQREIHIYW